MVIRSAASTALRIAAAFAATLALGACAEKVSGPGKAPDELTALPRALTVSEERVRNASNAFSAVLWREVNAAEAGKNVFLSPLSASFALGMTLNGASGTTYDEMHSALQFGDMQLTDINHGYRSLIALLLSLDPTVEMRVANSIWANASFPFHQTFFDTTAKYFDATSAALDFADKPASLARINGWVSTSTNGRIPKVLDDISPNHVMFLINAIYFKGRWRYQFDPAKTTDGVFEGRSGSQSARFMRRGDVAAMRGSNFSAVELPYGNGAFVMNVLLPDAAVDFEEFAANLPAAALNSATYTTKNAGLQLPRLRFSYEKKLNDQLMALGMRVPFDPAAAEFRALSPLGDQLSIDFVKQNTFVEIDEVGTEAAAVTVVGIIRTSAPPEIIVNRPYVFVLRERLSGTILFMGKIVDIP
jgi:serpin B